MKNKNPTEGASSSPPSLSPVFRYILPFYSPSRASAPPSPSSRPQLCRSRLQAPIAPCSLGLILRTGERGISPRFIPRSPPTRLPPPSFSLSSFLFLTLVSDQNSMKKRRQMTCRQRKRSQSRFLSADLLLLAGNSASIHPTIISAALHRLYVRAVDVLHGIVIPLDLSDHDSLVRSAAPSSPAGRRRRRRALPSPTTRLHSKQALPLSQTPRSSLFPPPARRRRPRSPLRHCQLRFWVGAPQGGRQKEISGRRRRSP